MRITWERLSLKQYPLTSRCIKTHLQKGASHLCYLYKPLGKKIKPVPAFLVYIITKKNPSRKCRGSANQICTHTENLGGREERALLQQESCSSDLYITNPANHPDRYIFKNKEHETGNNPQQKPCRESANIRKNTQTY